MRPESPEDQPPASASGVPGPAPSNPAPSSPVPSGRAAEPPGLGSHTGSRPAAPGSATRPGDPGESSGGDSRPRAAKPSDAGQAVQTLRRILESRNLVNAAVFEDVISRARETGKGIPQLLVDEGHIRRADWEMIKKELQAMQAANLRIPGFEIQGFLGAGAMAMVYKARQMSLDRTVAIKILPEKFSSDPEFVKRFAEEGKIAAKLNHPHIVQAYDEGMSDGQHWFAMEYIDGTTVHDEIMANGAYPEKRVMEVALAVADALAHAHHAGLIHRDVKPKNIMLTLRGTPKLADMGLAVMSSNPDESEKGRIFGTPAYIAPEQAQRDGVVDARADIYSFGASLYHMATGRLPFQAETGAQMVQMHMSAELESPQRVNPKISSGLSDIIEVCMAKLPAARYTTAEDLLADLKAVAKGQMPTIARSHYTLETLSAIDIKEVPKEAMTKVARPPTQEEILKVEEAFKPLHQQKIFWIAVAGWALALIMFIVLLFS